MACERSLDVTHVVEVGQRCARAIPAGVEGEDGLLKHTLEQTDGAGLVLKYRPVKAIAADDTKAELLVELTRRGQILNGEANGEVSETHGCASCVLTFDGFPSAPGRATGENTRHQAYNCSCQLCLQGRFRRVS